jgi:hypothetical protein
VADISEPFGQIFIFKLGLQQFQSPDQLGPALVYLDEALEGVQLEAEQQH